METIKIFLAGAKNLQEERLKLKALANALTFKYGQEGKKVTINMSSYEDFGDRQTVYDNFIKTAKEKYFAKYGKEPKVYNVVIGDGSRKISD